MEIFKTLRNHPRTSPLLAVSSQVPWLAPNLQNVPGKPVVKWVFLTQSVGNDHSTSLGNELNVSH